MTIMVLQRFARFASTSTTTAVRRVQVAQVQRHSLPALPLASTSALTTDGFNNNNTEQRRSFWMDVIRIKTNRPNSKYGYSKDGKTGVTEKHEDPEQVIRRHMDETRSDGESLLDLMFFNEKHEKKWMKRVRLQNKKRYEFDKKHVTDLAKYISFVQQNGDGEK
ncbi:hypothetical protein FRACYDRAFT_237352 [Fragilariopsis cylindrus CCMP1102]|uniref:Uncharacterized protein n=1 Tax=Fragilariopsis cylindrus CCMP1102 TaxID=635003 RepID=A0A1E7FLM3_9STRA|nr:hypothetical protein FRACYDRAFT_237352 [Fragilariopsis cylindrus CCMP1102]|eukprot:OEU19061.1 hypothetical protein FRACYDRAFT_237352 [Fragilariopsis cylindrus CCMP1102]